MLKIIKFSQDKNRTRWFTLKNKTRSADKKIGTNRKTNKKVKMRRYVKRKVFQLVRNKYY
jgi:hypothetical protein